MSKPRKILVDADALVAIAKQDDSNHERAIKIARSLAKETLFLSPTTIPEAATVLSYRVSHADAKRFLQEVRKRNLIELSLDFETQQKADEIFLSQKTKGISWFDCLNAAYVKLNEFEGIFSFDKFYKKIKIKMIGVN